MEPFDSDGRLDFRDYNIPGVAAETPFGMAELEAAMHVRTPDGRWVAGYMAWVEMLRVLPRLKWLARIAALRPLRVVGDWAYKLVAANRYRAPNWIFRWLRLPRPCDTACGLENRIRS